MCLSVLIVISMVASAVLVAQPYLTYASQAPLLSGISSDEYAAGNWLSQNTPPGGYVLTDPSTGYVLFGLALRNVSTSFLTPDYVGSYGGYNLSLAIFRFFNTVDLNESLSYLSELPQMPAFIVLSSRTAAWVSGGVNSSSSAPSGLSWDSFEGATKFSLPIFTLAASWPTVKVYTISPAVLNTAWTGTAQENGFDSWYLEGAYGGYSLNLNGGVLLETVQGSSPGDAQSGATFALANITEAGYLTINYSVETPAYSLELMVWRASGPPTVVVLGQSPGWHEAAVALSASSDDPLVRVGLVVWTQDTFIHSIMVSQLLLTTVVP